MGAFPNPYGSEFGPDSSQRSYGTSMTPGLGSSSDIMNIIMNMVMGQNIFPRPTGSNSIFDMAMMRQRNLDFHYIMQRSMVTNQIGASIGMKPGILSAMTYPLISAPDSPIARMMAPLMGGNLAKAQMGLYADMTGMTYAAFGGIGNISGGATDRMMENLQGVFYKPDGSAPNRRYAGGIDYKVSRGFNIEDFTQAFAGAGKYGLVGRGTTIEHIGDFAKKNGGVLDAARSLFGNNLSGGELMKEMNDLLGSSSVNLMDAGQKDKFEKLLRDTKSMTHIAGVGIESVKGIIAEIKALGDSRLAGGLGGLEASRITTKALGMTTAAMSVMDPEMVRLLGGQTGTAGRVGASFVTSQEHPISQQLGALFYQAKMTGNTAMEKYVANYAKTGYVSRGISGFDEPQYQAFLRQAAGMSGQNVHQMINYANNSPLASRRGIEAMPELGEVGSKAEMQRMTSIMGLLSEGHSPLYGDIAMRLGMGDGEGMDFASLNKAYGGRLNPRHIASLKKNIAAARAGKKGAALTITDIAAALGVADPSITEVVSRGGDIRALGMYNKDVISRNANIQQTVDFYSGQASTMSKEIGDLNAPAVQRAFQDLIAGHLSTDGLNVLKKSISGGFLASSSGKIGELQAFSLLSDGKDLNLDRTKRAGVIVAGGDKLMTLLGKKGMSRDELQKELAKSENADALSAYNLIGMDKASYASRDIASQYMVAYGSNQLYKKGFDEATKGEFKKAVMRQWGQVTDLDVRDEFKKNNINLEVVANMSAKELATYKQNPVVAASIAKLSKQAQGVMTSFEGMHDQFSERMGSPKFEVPDAKTDLPALIQALIDAVIGLDGTLKGVKGGG